MPSGPASTGHTPAVHPAQGGLLPHWHAPPVEQLSAVVGSHTEQLPPSTPHEPRPGIAHVVPLQQPLGQDVASQTHTWPRHLWPAAHADPVLPQAQVPPGQLSATGPQLIQEAPAAAHVVEEKGVQVFPEQHPPGQDVASQTQLPWKHRWPATHAAPTLQVHCPAVHPSPLLPHDWQAPPFVPQAVGDPDTQTPFAQHPFGHDAASHVQTEFWHSRPAAQAGPPPHVQLPDAEQPSAAAPHEEHAPPVMPHAVALRGVQTEPVQHPLGQLEALQSVQVPPLQI